VKESAAEATARLCAETSAVGGSVTEYHPTAGLHAAWVCIVHDSFIHLFLASTTRSA